MGGILAVLFPTSSKKAWPHDCLGFCFNGNHNALFAYSSNPLLSVILCIMMGPLYQVRDVSQTVILQDTLTDEERAPVTAAKIPFDCMVYHNNRHHGGFGRLDRGTKRIYRCRCIICRNSRCHIFVRDLRTYSQSARQQTKGK
ncbi:hypothetical protein PO124_03490 [Bacillus licheniformis]|nr:hypothetical protein [Bacillus licheniformis]